MIHKIFTIFDQKAHAYLPPFVMHQRGMAIRVFSDCINSPDHQFGKHPEDYTIFEIGLFNDENATLVPAQVPEVIGNGVEFVGIEPPPQEKGNSHETKIGDDTSVQPSSSG